MPETLATAETPNVPVSVGLHPKLMNAAGAESTTAQTLQGLVHQMFAGLLDALGIPGKPVVEVVLDFALDGGSRLFRLVVNGHPCHYPDLLVTRTYCFLRRIPFSPRPGLEELAAQSGGFLTSLVAVSCLHAIETQPSLLLAPEQVTAYLSSFKMADALSTPAEASEWLSVFQTVLDLRLSLADREAVGQVLVQAGLEDRPLQNVREKLIDRLALNGIKILIHPEYLREITLDSPGSDRFVALRDALFNELGVVLPDFRFTVEASLAPYSFAFTLNHLTGIPWTGLLHDQILVDADTLWLRSHGLPEGIAALDPEHGQEVNIFPSLVAAKLKERGRTVWNPLDYLVLCLAAEIRAHASCFFSNTLLSGQIEKLDSWYPALMGAVRALKRLEDLPAVARGLVREHIGAPGLKSILERLLDFDYIVADSIRDVVLEDRVQVPAPPQSDADRVLAMTEFVRLSFKLYITERIAKGQEVALWRVDLEIENRLLEQAADRSSGAQGEGELGERILDAVRQAFLTNQNNQYAPILTGAAVRPLLRRIVAAEYPHTTVIAREELVPTVQLRTVGQISFS